jgi:O-antigen ligase/polysaccharide polymerase Wzy-like membrane protein
MVDSRIRRGGWPDWHSLRAWRSRQPGAIGTVALGASLAVAVGLTAFSGGGFDASSQSVFVALAGATLLAAVAVDSGAAARAARSPLALTLAAVAVLSIASVAWTVGARTASLRWGLTIAGYGGIFVAAATFTRAAGPRPLAAGIAALAMSEAILGLGAVAFHSLPDAEWLGGVWRPGGTFQYPPALAILQVCALPVLSSSLSRASDLVASIAAAAAMLDGAVLSLSGSRLAFALAAALLIILILRPSVGRSRRGAAIATTTLVAVGVALGPAVLGGHVGPTTPGVGAAGFAKILGLAVVSGVALLLTRRATTLRHAAWLAPTLCVVALGLAAVGWASSYYARPYHARPAPRSSTSLTPAARQPDFLHGRSHEWEAALQTWFDHPLLGAGANAYYIASLPHQGAATTRYAHDLPLELAAELGVCGLLLGLALYASAAQTISRATKSSALWLLAPAAVAILASNLADWTWHLAGLGAVWAAAAGGLEGSRGDSGRAGGWLPPREVNQIPVGPTSSSELSLQRRSGSGSLGRPAGTP